MWRKLSRPLLGLAGLAQCRRWASAMLLLPRRAVVCVVMPFPLAAVGPPARLRLILVLGSTRYAAGVSLGKGMINLSG